MEPLLNSLNQSQKEAATCVGQHVRIVAGAGSGKTRVLMARIEYLINELGVYPSKIMAITFTNKATWEMKNRLTKQMGEMDAARVRISTIHSLCVRILREDASAAGFPRNFEILDTDDQKSLLRRIYKENEINLKDHPLALAMEEISNIRKQEAARRLPKYKDDILDIPEQEMDSQVVFAAKEYLRRLDEMRAMDFDDLLLQAHKLLAEHEQVRTKWQNRLDYIHVDEFQDVDPIQYDIIRLITRDDAILTVVGDPDQTIYSWRGASINIIMNFEKDFPNTKTVILDQNYRSLQPILEASNALIANNRNRIEKSLFSDKESTTLLDFFAADDLESEAWKVIETLRKDRGQSKRKWEDYMILYRSNYLSRSFEKVLRLNRIPYRLIGGVRFFERKEVKDILAYIKLLTQPDPTDPKQLALDIPLERIINEPKRGIGNKMIHDLELLAKERDCNVLSVLKDASSLTKAQAKKATQFVEMIESLQTKFNHYVEQGEVDQIIDDILDDTGYRLMLNALGQEGKDRLDNIKELQNDLHEAISDTQDFTIEEYLQNISLLSDSNKENQANGVTLMTVHAAKGTEAPVVFIVGVNEGVFPALRSIETRGSSALEEERRLMYVAMTRAQEKLYISWNSGYSFQMGEFSKPSRFVVEIPEKWIERKPEPSSTLLQSDDLRKVRAPKKDDLVLTSASGKTLGVIHGGKNNNRAQTLNSRRIAPTKTKDKIKAGDFVEHPKFGVGTVLDVAPTALTIEFSQGYGQKRIAPGFVKKKVME